jgi:hypothetical protein
MADIPEEAPVPDGVYNLRIFSAREGKAPSGRNTVRCSISIEDPHYPNAQPFTHTLTIPNQDDWTSEDPKVKQAAFRMARNNRRFFHLFNVEYSDEGFDTDDLVEATSNNVPLTQREDSREGHEGTFYNNIKLPRIKG